MLVPGLLWEQPDEWVWRRGNSRSWWENSFIEGKREEAEEMMDRRDAPEVPLVALALSLPGHDGI